MLFVFLAVTIGCLYATFRYRKPWMLTIPFLTLFGYMIVQIVMVPLDFMETVRFIFSLR
ncbi:hypothetical protein C8P63_10360 [Melghirimyces profundicolus]|uniref:Uncharacterized protein n=1 Tax=Melghirimyces profundicolus TaxID=1242148 RepID=A0A2T6C7I9_9BACL|nr:hypothetical protein [Melghirimyces profundicolus]PTX64277.1 hypothetical protein C8P63_10360 [Melghirimyces profundicolus]